MKSIYRVVFVIITILICNLANATEKENSFEWAASISNSDFKIRKSLNEKNELLFGFSYIAQIYKDDYRDYTRHNIGALIGFRRYFSKREYNYFAGTDLIGQQFIEDGDIGSRIYSLRMMYGIEKYFSDRFSVEGSVGISAVLRNQDNISLNDVVIPVTNIAINYYFK